MTCSSVSAVPVSDNRRIGLGRPGRHGRYTATGCGKSRAPLPPLLQDSGGVRNVMRAHPYSIHTERSYLDWWGASLRARRGPRQQKTERTESRRPPAAVPDAGLIACGRLLNLIQN
jgi:hypothetical protein